MQRLTLLLWMLGMPGGLGIVFVTLPQLMHAKADMPPPWIIAAAGALQSAVVLALAVWTGGRLASRVGLATPVLQALVEAKPVAAALRSTLSAGLGVGLIAGVGLFAVTAMAPAEFVAMRAGIDIPLLWRVLYGGITEELLLRWGVMTLLVWLGWRFLQGGVGAPDARWFWSAILISAVLFGIGHLPALAAHAGSISAQLAAYVVFANAVFGMAFGYLYWRVGLEAAMIAHAAAHVIAYWASRS